MNINLLPAAVVEWLKSQGTTLLQGQRPVTRPLQFEPGKTYEGRLLQNLAGGRSLVQIANQLLDMALPKGSKPGDTLRLTYLKAAPQPTFLLQPQPGRIGETQAVRLSEAASRIATLVRWAGTTAMPAGASQSANPISQAVTQPSGNPTSATPGGAAQAAQLKAALPDAAGLTARAPAAGQAAGGPASNYVANQTANQATPGLVGRLAQPDASQLGARLVAPPLPGGTTPASSAALLASVPLLEEGSAEAEAWLGPLRQAVKTSGLFYEAHQARWVRGEQTLAELQREPQAKLAQAEFAGNRVAELDGMPEEAARLAGRQLQMLEGQPFVWQGQAWPGQMLQWLIEERPEGEGGGEEEPPAWRTQMRLKLPRLGGVFAEIDLMAQGLRFRLRADDAQTLAQMREAVPLLTKRLDAAGLAVLAVRIEPGFAEAEEGDGVAG
ncbi:flagellar hook-length control protein FliK [Sulfuritortus calidifontis]|uniref:Flagellar hook-length control protein FliK n=1 Tax=Sulfuritortus calidifontis TaxID=1914471 RepID=A0A4R3JSL3_9PROT|nr:flagellar hook-length control protein FliK [Sulfuritortus calidifontis]TCS70141.1 flagellar hook-length control protein FliK [Sulfuritortus calidifontis]